MIFEALEAEKGMLIKAEDGFEYYLPYWLARELELKKGKWSIKKSEYSGTWIKRSRNGNLGVFKKYGPEDGRLKAVCWDKLASTLGLNNLPGESIRYCLIKVR